VLDVAVDPEQRRVLAADPQDEAALAVDLDPEVPVGDPAAERLDAAHAAGPEALRDLPCVHAGRSY
jgi:hypothetical protein